MKPSPHNNNPIVETCMYFSFNGGGKHVYSGVPPAPLPLRGGCLRTLMIMRFHRLYTWGAG